MKTHVRDIYKNSHDLQRRFTMTGSDPGTPTGAGTPADEGAPADAGICAQQPSLAEPVARRVHRILVPGLLVLATVIGIPATFAIWVNRQALNTFNWSSTSSKILQDKKGAPE